MAIFGDLSITVDDGTTLTAGSDIALARKWAEHDSGPVAWSAMSRSQQWATIADALGKLRDAYRACE